MYRLLFTGSRDWIDRSYVKNLLNGFIPIREEVIVVNGKAPGLDEIVSEVAEELGWPKELIEEHPWEPHGSPRNRNRYMVDLGANLCFAYALAWHSGTGMCARMARRAGIPVIDFGVNTK